MKDWGEIFKLLNILLDPENSKLRDDMKRMASYKKAVAYADEYMYRDFLILEDDDLTEKEIKKFIKEKQTLRRKFDKTLKRN